jgi:cathepsin L
MKAVLFVALLGVAVCSAHLFSESEYQFLFSKWIAQHNKKYNHENFFYRYTVFKRNMDHIVSHNKKGHSYTLGMNAFGDMTPEEFESTMKGYNRISRGVLRAANTERLPARKAAASIDWVAKGAVTPVKNQQQCGSCWAFSATGSLEGAHFIKTGSLVSFSEQQLVDCSQAEGNQGCNGGLMDQAFQFVIDNKGLCTEESYPYTAQDGTCQTTCKKVEFISSFKDVPTMNEGALMTAVNMRPVSIAIEADQQVFQFYSGGVLDDPSCGTQLDHGVLVVGYGTDSDSGADYWKVKNSWGAQWGESGYIRMVRNKNQCGLATEPSYPINQ